MIEIFSLIIVSSVAVIVFDYVFVWWKPSKKLRKKVIANLNRLGWVILPKYYQKKRLSEVFYGIFSECCSFETIVPRISGLKIYQCTKCKRCFHKK